MSFCANAGVSLDIVAEIVGHGSPSMTRHYAHFSHAAKSAVIDALPSQTLNTEEKNDDAAENPAKTELLEKLAKLPQDKIDKIMKLLEGK